MAKNKGISLNPQDPVHRLFKLAGKLSFSLALVFLPIAANAGLFSILADIFNGDTSLTTAPIANVRNMALLQAALNPDPNPSKGGGDITVVGGSALLPETGPTGTIADVLNGCSVVVCRHSNVAVDACIAGVPVECEGGARTGGDREEDGDPGGEGKGGRQVED